MFVPSGVRLPISALADGATGPGEIARFVAALCSDANFLNRSRSVVGGGSSDVTR
jgi:hypothetical protein